MGWIRSRISRTRRFGGVLSVALVGSVAIYTAIAFWWDKFGAWGMASLGVVVVLMYGAFTLVPEKALQRLTGESTFVEDLGLLHAEGIQLLQNLPRSLDTDPPGPLDAWESTAENRRLRVVKLLSDSGGRWVGVFNSPVPTGVRTVMAGYTRTTNLRFWIDERLERLSQIMAAV